MLMICIFVVDASFFLRGWIMSGVLSFVHVWRGVVCRPSRWICCESSLKRAMQGNLSWKLEMLSEQCVVQQYCSLGHQEQQSLSWASGRR
jgi:hypothetical protein